MALGVGFMSEPEKSIYVYVILLLPLFLASLFLGYNIKQKKIVHGLLLAICAFVVFLLMPPHSPMPLIFSNQVSPSSQAIAAQLLYQLALYIVTSLVGTVLGSKISIYLPKALTHHSRGTR